MAAVGKIGSPNEGLSLLSLDSKVPLVGITEDDLSDGDISDESPIEGLTLLPLD